MKKTIILLLFLTIIITVLFPSGSADSQSQALLFKQKRTTWPSAPDSAVFYECFLVNIKGEYGDAETILLDSFVKDGIIIVNLSSSMKIDVTNVKEMIKKDNVIYKCTVLYSNSFFGTAVVNIFKSDLVKENIGYIIGSYLIYLLEENDLIYIETVFSYYYSEYNEEPKQIYVYLPQSKRSFLQLDQWPNPKEIKIIDGLILMKENYDKYILELNNLINNKELDAYNIQYINEKKIEAKKNYDRVYSVLSKYSIIKL